MFEIFCHVITSENKYKLSRFVNFKTANLRFVVILYLRSEIVFNSSGIEQITLAAISLT